MALKSFKFRVAGITESQTPGATAANAGPRIVVLRLVPDTAAPDADLASPFGAFEVSLTPAAVKRLGLAHDDALEVVLSRPGQP